MQKRETDPLSNILQVEAVGKSEKRNAETNICESTFMEVPNQSAYTFAFSPGLENR